MTMSLIPIAVAGTNSMYVIKTSNVPVPNHYTSPAEFRAIVPNYLEMGALNGHSLQLLERVISVRICNGACL